MKIKRDSAVQPPKFSDTRLNNGFGTTVGRLSEDDVQAIVLRHTEVQVARWFRRLWLEQVESVGRSGEVNRGVYESLVASKVCPSVADEVLEFLNLDQGQVDRESVLARGQVLLCARVIAVLTELLAGAPSTNGYRVGGARDGSPLRHLEKSADALDRARERVAVANEAWSAGMTEFGAKVKARNAFARTAGSVTLAHIDALSAEIFEEQTSRLLERDGCTILRRRGGANDQGADNIALTPGGLRIVLQCKHSTKLRNRVDPRYVYELNGTARQAHGADIVGIVTNRTLSNAARTFAVQNGIHVVDRPILTQWATYGVPWLPSDRQGAALA